MSTLTKEQWDTIAEQLDSLFATVYLLCDGYLVSARLARITKNQLAIVVYINGTLKGEWCQIVEDPNKLCEEARRFFMPRKRQKISAKKLKDLEKALGKRWCRKQGYYEKWIFPDAAWSSPRSFINHLKKHNQSIARLTYTQYAELLQQYEKQQQPDSAA